jgi:gamma-glutamylcyclotransferase (GGCT)/AIG2-like uncharacterized protein YtfP
MILPAKFFVYGTLQRGEERAKFWPRTPLEVETAYLFARLHDLGPYPAIVDGGDRVRGELWTLAEPDVPATLEALDKVEGFQQGGPDWYVRRLVECFTLDGRPHEAYSYFWGGRHDIAHMPVVSANGDGFCDWKEFKTRHSHGSTHR